MAINLGAIGADGFKIGGADVDKIYLGADEVYSSAPPFVSPITILASATLVAGTDFPSNIPITIDLAGGGGSGSFKTNSSYIGGGYRGVYSTGVETFANGAIVEAVIGAGGAGVPVEQNGLSGGATQFSAVIGAGGFGGGTQGDLQEYKGDEAEYVSVYDGTVYTDGKQALLGSGTGRGGQASDFGNGGDGIKSIPSFAGVAAGGGGKWQSTPEGVSGSGGRGVIVLSWI